MATKHHYVPQFYIKLFKIPETKAGVFMYERNKEPTQKNAANIVFKRGFYNYTEKNTGKKTEALEKTFSEIEDKVKPIIDSLVVDQTKQLTEKEKANLIYYIAHQRTRNMAYRETLKTNYTAALQSMLAVEVGGLTEFREKIDGVTSGKISDEKVEVYRKKVLDNKYNFELRNEEALLHQALKSAQIAYSILMKKSVSFYKSTNNNYFITSDNPVNVHFDSPFEGIYGDGGLMHSVVTFPICPNLTLILANDERKQDAVEIEPNLVDRLNVMQCWSSLDYLFADRSSSKIKRMFDRTKRGTGQAVTVDYAGESTTFMPEGR